jgi:hypothetical protein
MIAIIAIVAFVVLGFGGCAMCVCLAPKGGTASSSGGTSGTTGTSNWITNAHPPVKFIAPPGFTKGISGDWGVFKAPDGAATFAFTSFSQPGESTVRLSAAAGVLGATDIDWRQPKTGNIGHDAFPARTGEGSCNFRGPNGYIWYATVNSGSTDQILLIYTLSATASAADKAAIVTALNSLQRQ